MICYTKFLDTMHAGRINTVPYDHQQQHIIIIIIINPCKPYLTASAPRLTHWGGGK
jgi:hypothetical protein